MISLLNSVNELRAPEETKVFESKAFEEAGPLGCPYLTRRLLTSSPRLGSSYKIRHLLPNQDLLCLLANLFYKK